MHFQVKLAVRAAALMAAGVAGLAAPQMANAQLFVNNPDFNALRLPLVEAAAAPPPAPGS